jgi:hypothetical protein
VGPRPCRRTCGAACDLSPNRRSCSVKRAVFIILDVAVTMRHCILSGLMR